MNTRQISEQDEDYLVCHDDRCVLFAEDLMDEVPTDSPSSRFNRVLSDIASVYPEAILVGAVAAAKYVRYPQEPRPTLDVDVLLNEKDFAEFLLDEIPDGTLKRLETYFHDSDSANHSLKHKETGVFVDLLSTESQPIRKKIVKHILQNRDKTTALLHTSEGDIRILKPEFLIAMKVIRHSKDPHSERGLSDRLDVVKILETCCEKNTDIDHETVRKFLNDIEIRKYNAILKDVPCEMQD